jgi:hypothetical protein
MSRRLFSYLYFSFTGDIKLKLVIRVLGLFFIFVCFLSSYEFKIGFIDGFKVCLEFDSD